ncbi:MAG: glycosyltransferase [Chloroflexota bacterium]|nr:glycosyltransferase [Chloroflexota bacterium]
MFTVSGGYGHLHPLVPLARALQTAGHAVAFAVGPTLQPLVEAAGFTAFPAGINRERDAAYQQFKAQQQRMPLNLATELFSYPQLFCGISTRLRTPILVEIARRWQPDLLIREAGEYGAVIAAEHLGLPHATVAFAAALGSMAQFEREAAAQLDPLRRRWGLAADPGLTALYRDLYLSYAPPSFSLQDVGGPAVAGAVPPTTHHIRPEFFDQAAPAGLPAWVAQLPAQPTVYVTLGTEVNKEPDLYPSVLQTIIAGLHAAPINLIVTLGREGDPADFAPQPANVHIARYIPQSLLLPYCDLLVMHGGSNTLLAALDLGLPLVVVPLIADQFFNATVTHRLRLGQVVPRDQLTPAAIRTAVDNVLTDPLYGQTARRLQAELQALPDQQYAVGLVERLVADHPRRT